MDIVDRIIQLKKDTKRENFFFLRRRVDKGNGKKTLGWIMQEDNGNSTESVDISTLLNIKRNIENEHSL